MSPSPCYLDLLAPDGTVDRPAFEAILERRIAAEIDLRLCVAARLHAPRELSLGDVRAWRALQTRRLDPALVPPSERARIAHEERAALEAFVTAMRQGAAAQRAAMAQTALRQAAE